MHLTVSGDGVGTLAESGITVAPDGTLGSGSELVVNSGSLTENAAATLDHSASLSNAQGGTWDIASDPGIALGSEATGSITYAGTFEKTAASGASVIAVDLVNDGTIIAASGTLDFTGGSTNHGRIIENGGTVIVGPQPGPALFNQHVAGIAADRAANAVAAVTRECLRRRCRRRGTRPEAFPPMAVRAAPCPGCTRDAACPSLLLPAPMQPMPARSIPSPLPLAHRLWRLLPAGPRRRAFAGLTAALAPRPDRRAPAAANGVIVAGAFSRATGLGEGARLMRDALGTMGVACWPLDLSGDMWPGQPTDFDQPAACSLGALPEGAALVLHVNPPMLPWVLFRQGSRLVRGRRVIGYWAWELETAPPLWHPGAALVHEVWVPSQFTAGAMEKFMPGRVRVVPHPLAVAPPRPSPRDRHSFGLPEKAVIVLVSFNLASSFVRKNPLAAIAAFRKAFGERRDRMLVIKVGNPEAEARDFATLERAVAGSPNLRLVTDVLSGADNQALTKAADIVLSLHRSEGFGLVPAEAMLLGKAVVATGWSGNLDFMDETSAALVGYRLIPARDPRGVFEAPGAVWAEPDLDEAAGLLARLGDDACWRAELGARAESTARKKLGTAPLAAALAAAGQVP